MPALPPEQRVAAALAPAGLDLVARGPDGIVVGNGRALWPRFVAWLAADPARADLPHPLEAYVEAAIRPVAAAVGATAVRFAHEGPPWLPIQEIAARAGLAWIAPSRLAVHPARGPWISLRAVLTVGAAAPPPAAPPCPACPGACAPAFARAQATLDRADPAGSMRAAWRLWLAVRDACPIGREHRYQDDHLEYGYTNDRAVLRRALTTPAPR